MLRRDKPGMSEEFILVLVVVVVAAAVTVA